MIGNGIPHPSNPIMYIYQNSAWSSSGKVLAVRASYPSTTYANNIEQIACDQTGQICVAVGYTTQPYNTPQNTQYTLVYTTKNGGATWVGPQLLPLPAYLSSGDLSSIGGGG